MRNGWFPFIHHYKQCCMRALACFLWAFTVTKRASVWCVLRVHSRSDAVIFSVWSECISLFKELPNYFPRYLYFLYFSQQCVWVPVAPILTNTWYCVFLILGILINARVAHGLALICLSLMTTDVEHHFRLLLAIDVSSLQRVLNFLASFYWVAIFLLSWCKFSHMLD